MRCKKCSGRCYCYPRQVGYRLQYVAASSNNHTNCGYYGVWYGMACMESTQQTVGSCSYTVQHSARSITNRVVEYSEDCIVRGVMARNQCDGCARKLPIRSGNLHYGKGYDFIACTAHLYEQQCTVCLQPSKVDPCNACWEDFRKYRSSLMK